MEASTTRTRTTKRERGLAIANTATATTSAVHGKHNLAAATSLRRHRRREASDDGNQRHLRHVIVSSFRPEHSSRPQHFAVVAAQSEPFVHHGPRGTAKFNRDPLLGEVNRGPWRECSAGQGWL